MRPKTTLRKKTNLILLALAIALTAIFILIMNFEKDVYTIISKEGDVSLITVYAPFDFYYPSGSPQDVKIGAFLAGTTEEAGNEVVEVKKGEIVVEKGVRIKAQDTDRLAALSKVYKKRGILLYLAGSSVFVVLFVFMIFFYLNVFEKKLLNTKNIALTGMMMVLLIGWAKAVMLFQVSSYFIPVAAISIIISVLLSHRFALFFTFVLGAIAGVITGNKFAVAVVLILGSVAAIFSVMHLRRRAQLLRAGLYAGLVNFAGIYAIGLMSNLDQRSILNEGMWGLGIGIVSSAIAMVILPVLEHMFNYTTDITLLELSDLNHPLLKELAVKAPGTYHHSLIVGNLAESACDKVGANSLLARVASYYHDVGKIEKPEFFSENQTDSSKHDKLTPTMSSLIIVNHVKKGIQIARKHKLNKTIIDFIPQHHGTSLIYYFYQKELEEMQDAGKVDEANFRYPGPKPQSKEAAIILLADSVEAASRSTLNPTPAHISGMVRRVINNKFIDGQLDDCELTLKDLHKITDAFSHVLAGVYHKRHEHPKMKEQDIDIDSKFAR